jgi:DNA polymerase-1
LYRVALSQKVQPLNLADDVSIAAYLDNPGQTDYSLKKLIDTYLIGEVAPTAAALPKLAAALKEQLGFKHLTALYRDLELPLVPVLAKMELAGVTVDAELLENKDKEFALKLANLEAQAKKEAEDENFNPQSPKQLGVILFEKLKLPVIKKTKTGYSTDVTVLEQLAGQHPLVDTILQYRILAKLYSTYLEGLKPLLNKTTGRVHTHFQQLVTVTGRLSSTDPNLQNIPTRTEIGRGIRELFVPGPGYDCLMSCDYSQIELRILAHIAQDPLLIESFRTGQDVHARTAAEVFGLPLEQVTPELRGRAKAVNFGIVYGISDFGLAKQIGSSRKEAAQFIESYFASYQGVKKYMEQSVELARTQGYVTTLLGRRRYLPDIRSSNFNRRNFAERTAMNTPYPGFGGGYHEVGHAQGGRGAESCRRQEQGAAPGARRTDPGSDRSRERAGGQPGAKSHDGSL